MSSIAPLQQLRTVTTFDDSWYRAITSFAQHTGWLQEPMKLYTEGSLVVLGLMALYGWWSARSRSDRGAMAAIAWLGLGTLISLGAGLTLKSIFEENRPCQVIHVATVQACPGLTDYSFPSDHTTFGVALALGLWLVARKLGIIALALAAVEGFSRVYLGQHYPHDVLAGAVLSGVIMLTGWLATRAVLARILAGLEATPLKVLLVAAPQRQKTPA